DGTRRPGLAASGTMALVRGRALQAPVGTPIGLGSFSFHDRTADPGGGDRVALIAFDADEAPALWRTAPGAALAARVRALPAAVVGPLDAVREDATQALAAQGGQTAEAAGVRSVVGYELATLAATYLFGAGEAARYVDERF